MGENFKRYVVTLPNGEQYHVGCKDTDEARRLFAAPPGMPGVPREDIKVEEDRDANNNSVPDGF